MVRYDIEKIVNKLASDYHTFRTAYDNMDVVKAYNLIFNYCKKNKTSPSSNSYTLDNGVLVINGTHIDRVCPLIKPYNTFDEQSYYYESRCIRDY